MSLLVFLAAIATAPAQCAAVSVAVTKEMPSAFTAELVSEVSANFTIAYSKACTEGLLAKKRLVTVGRRLFLWNAPNANVASIYANDGRMLLEYPFLSDDQETHVPSAEVLHEAIYCAVHGAAEVEQEESGRCLPD